MITEIIDDVYDITCLDEPNGKRYRVFLFTDGTPTLVDAGLSTTTDAVKKAIDEIGVEPKRLIITHADGDHIGGFDNIAAMYELETWVPEQTEISLSESIDYRYGDGEKIGRFTAVHMPGHRHDNHALVDETDGLVVTGDAISGADQRGLEEGYFHLPPAIYSEDLNQAEESLDRLLVYDFDVALVYHGSSVTENAHEKLDRYVNFPGK